MKIFAFEGAGMSYKLKGLFELVYVPMFSLNKKFHLPRGICMAPSRNVY